MEDENSYEGLKMNQLLIETYFLVYNNFKRGEFMKFQIRVIIAFISVISFTGCTGQEVVSVKKDSVDCLFTESFNNITSLIKPNKDEIKNATYAGEWLQGKYYDISYRANKGTV